MKRHPANKYEDWRDIRKFRTKSLTDLDWLSKCGFDVVELTPYHFRIDGKLDIYPTSGAYHDLINNVRGVIERTHDSTCFGENTIRKSHEIYNFVNQFLNPFK